jgi:hypothetical protein
MRFHPKMPRKVKTSAFVYSNSQQHEMKNSNEIAQKFFGVSYDSLDEGSKKVAEHIYVGKHITKDTTKEFDKNTTFGQRAADAVATFGGSWTFIILFAAILIVWVILNSLILVKYHDNFDLPLYSAQSISLHACRYSSPYYFDVTKQASRKRSRQCRTRLRGEFKGRIRNYDAARKNRYVARKTVAGINGSSDRTN